MKDIGFPLFDLKSTNSYLFAAGGGGSKDYGKDNGVIALRKNRINKEPFILYKTVDFITQIETYTENEEEKTQEMRRLALKEAPKIGDTFESIDLDEESEEDSKPIETSKSTDSLKKSIETNKSTESLKKSIETSKNIDTIKTTPIFIAAIGEENFYLLKFDGSFNLVSKINKKINQAYLCNHLVILKGFTIHGFNDVISCKSSLEIKHTKMIESSENVPEEYVYKLYKKGKSVVALNELCTTDILENWVGFFIYEDKIHKILTVGDKNEFVFRNKKHQIEGRMSKVIVSDDTLVFYANKKTGYLYFIHDDVKVWELPKITAIAHFKNFTAVSTCERTLMTYLNGLFFKKYDIHSPISGITIDKNRIYFSLITGYLDYVGYNTKFTFLLKAISFVILLFTIMLAVIKTFK